MKINNFGHALSEVLQLPFFTSLGCFMWLSMCFLAAEAVQHRASYQLEKVQHERGVVPESEDCNWQCYLDRYEDLQIALGANNTTAAQEHWQHVGRIDGRACTCEASCPQMDVIHSQCQHKMSGMKKKGCEHDRMDCTVYDAYQCKLRCDVTPGCKSFAMRPKGCQLCGKDGTSVKSSVGSTVYSKTCAATLTGPESQTSESKRHSPKPHLVFFLVDDMGWNDFTTSSDLHVAWSSTKSLVQRSIMINTTYTQATCAPSRGSFITGRYSSFLQDFLDWGSFSTKSELTLPQKLASTGYMTYAIGKWHLGHAGWETTPTGRGFDRFFGVYGNAEHFSHCSRDHGHSYYDLHYQESPAYRARKTGLHGHTHKHHFEVGLIDQYSTEIYDRRAREFLSDHKQHFSATPFFLYYAMSAIHFPLEAPDKYYENCSEVLFPNENRRTVCAMVSAVDEAIQNLTSFLEREFANDQFVVIITGDNGSPSWPTNTSGGNNFPLRGSKGEVWEGGIRNHAVVWGSHADLLKPQGTTYTGGIMHLVDWHATIANLGGVNTDLNIHGTAVGDIDGFNMWEAITNNKPSPRRGFLVHYSAEGTAEAELLALQPSLHDRLHYRGLFEDYNHHAKCKKGARGAPMFAIRSQKWKLLFNMPYGWYCGGWWAVHNTTSDDIWLDRSGQPIAFDPFTNLSVFDHREVEILYGNHLFDIESDPSETKNLAAEYPDVVDDLIQQATAIHKGGRISRGCESFTCGGASCCDNSACCDGERERSMLNTSQREGANILGNPCYLKEDDAKKIPLALYPWFSLE